MRTGCPMHIVTVLPRQKQLGKGHSKRLSRKARHRLEIIDWYNQVSERKSRTGLKDPSLTCRHFGIERSYFYRWYGRFKKHGIAGLENRTSRPKRVRRETVGAEIVEEIRRIRQKNPTYSAKKIRPILLRYYEEHEVPCRSTISNVIKRHNFFFRADTKPFKRRSKSGVRAFERRRVKGKAELWLRSENITQLWTRPRTPKDKPCVERMIGTLQTECLDYLIGPMSVSELQAEIDSWLKKYYSYRPHESLGFLTPHDAIT